MIREAMQWIESKVLDAQKKDEVMIRDDIYTEKELTLVLPHVNKCKTLSVNNLSMLITNVKNEIKDDVHNLPLILNVEEKRVTCLTSYDVNKERQVPFVADAEVPQISFNDFISVEKMIIQLQTCFKDNENKANLISMISKLSKDTKVEMEDDGITQRVIAQEGISVKGTVTLPPLVKLVPQRTFYEAEQPEQMFLLRIDGNCRVALYDADGGAWKYQCQQSIIKYLSDQLKQEIEDGKVIIG
ncbi:hypothetical protein [Anaerorhabdus sp.]|uniref:hypothetical protein n=1 Tax=Anaerorhabdus sp. TaxID=1872524 RepID=UPI002B207BE6|nr:hypothetical protein [Anaerorhabdus sp.]MEA4875304.1 hypothetical protein [Anaerorhabdus sp.]